MKTLTTFLLLAICLFAKAQQEPDAPSYDVMTLKNGTQLKVNTLFSTNRFVYFNMLHDTGVFKLPPDSLKSYNTDSYVGNVTVGGELIKGSSTAQSGAILTVIGTALAFGLPQIAISASPTSRLTRYAALPGAGLMIVGGITWISAYTHTRRAGRMMVARMYK